MSIFRTAVTAKLRVFNQDMTDFRLLPVTAFTMNFAVNEIPSCSVQLALGTNISKSPLRVEVDAKARGYLQEHRQCQLLASITGDFAENSSWPDAAQVIFEGRIDHTAVTIVRGNATLNISILHWLGDLLSGSIVMDYASPLIPNSLKSLADGYGASGFDASITPGRLPAGIGAFADAEVLRLSGFAEDVWGKGIKPFINNLLVNELTTILQGSDCEQAQNRPSDELKVAWQRLAVSNPDSPAYSKWAVPLQLSSPTSVFPQPFLQSFTETITHDPVDTYQRADAWTKLVSGYCSTFDLAVVPRIDSALIVPSLPSVRIPYVHRLVADDVFQLDTLEPIRQPPSAVGVVRQFTSSFNASLGGLEITGKPVCFAPQDPSSSSRTAFISPPPWLKRTFVHLPSTTRNLQERRPPGGVAGPGQAIAPDQKALRDEVYQSQETILRNYARLHYYRERNRGRSLKVFGKLRFDIAPGSVVQTSVRLDQIRGLGLDSGQFQGYVGRVSIAVDAASRIGMTAFQLQHVRTLEENDSDRFTIDQHPIYQQNYYGCPLLDAYENLPGQTNAT